MKIQYIIKTFIYSYPSEKSREKRPGFPEWYKKTLPTLSKTSFYNEPVRTFLSLDLG